MTDLYKLVAKELRLSPEAVPANAVKKRAILSAQSELQIGKHLLTYRVSHPWRAMLKDRVFP